jgi:predicted RNA binding protein YcfA (HicA-like mRNA interferase family)
VGRFPAVAWPQFKRVLERRPLSYRVVKQSGSHRTMEADGRPRLLLAFHDDAELPPGLVRKILVRDIGLSEDEALKLLGKQQKGSAG